MAPIPPEEARAPMVGWYDPRQLLRTGIDVVVSSIFASRADRRLSQLQPTPPGSWPTPQPGKDGSFVVDFVADTGDGFNSTYAVAWTLAQLTLDLVDPETGAKVRTRRADILVMGGDEVYPAASPERYRDRLVAPFRLALDHTKDPAPRLFAIPGNHDWFDNLVAWSELFQARAWLGGWRLEQERSYFACPLPYGWWLVGADVQLESDVDAMQVEYFRQVAKQMKEDDRIILCTAEPHWVYEGEARHPHKHDVAARNLQFLEDNVFRGRIRVFLSGDQHHYRRHANKAGIQKITAGGGGAFLHPTHGWSEKPLPRGFALKTKSVFPSWWTSWLYNLRNLFFAIRNPWFMAVTAGAYLMVYLTVAGILAAWNRGAVSAWSAVKATLLVNPGAMLVSLAVLGGFVAFTDTSSKIYRVVGGLTHGAAHLAVAFALACRLRETIVGWQPSSPWRQQAAALVGQALLGGLAGAIIMGLYLLVSLNVFRRHRNEAFSALRIPDYKNFLRLRLDPSGDLTIFPVGIRRVPRAWKTASVPREDDPTQTREALVPVSGPRGGSGAALIEGPILVPRNAV